MLFCLRVVAPAALALCCAAFARAASPDTGALERLLVRVPDNAQLVVVVPSLSRAADGITAFAKAAGVPIERPLTGRDLIDEFGTPPDSLDQSGPLIFAMSAVHGEPIVVARAVATVTQPTSRPARTIAGVSVIESDDGLLARLDDGIVVFARDEATLQPALESRGVLGKTLATELTGRYADRHAVVYVDVVAWKDRAEVVLNMIQQTSMMGLAAAGPEAAEAIHMQRWFFEQFRSFLGEARTYTAGITLSADGIAYDDRISVNADGALGKYLAAVRPSERDLLRGLACTRPAAVFALEWSVPPELRSVEEKLYEAIIVTEERRERIGAERLAAGLERVRSATRRLTGYNGAMEWRPKANIMAMTGVYLTEDPNAYIANFRAMFRETPELFEIWASLPGGSKVEHSSRVVGDVPIDDFKFTVSGSTPVESAIGAIYGDNPTLALAPSRHGAAFYMGPNDEAGALLERMIANDPNTTLATEPRVKAALARLAPRPQLVMLLDMMRLLELSMEMSRVMGVPGVRVPQVGDTSDFVAYGLYLQGDGARQQVFVPAGAVRDVVRSFIQTEDAAGDSKN